MSRIVIAPIVEGHGEDAAVRTLLWRTWTEVVGGEHADVLRPIRRRRSTFLMPDSIDLTHALGLAHNKLGVREDPTLILIMIDAEGDCATLGSLGPMLLRRARAARPDLSNIACVIANVMYETWFVAAAESLGDRITLRPGEVFPADPESDRYGKGWVKQRIRGGKYSETADQAALTARMDLAACRRRSKSYDKLCRVLRERLTTQ